MEEIGLREAVEAIRHELLEASSQAADKDVRFTVGPIELEFTIELRKEAGGRAGVKAWVLSGDIQAKGAHVRTQKVKVILNPENRQGGPVPIQGRGSIAPASPPSEY